MSERLKLPFKRRRKGITNYYKRKKMIISGKSRVTVRKTNRYIIVQFIKSKPIGDEVLTAANSSELFYKYSWKGDLNNTPAAYLTGLLAGLKAKKQGIKDAILDIGLHRPIRGSRVFAALKGIIDSGINVPHNLSILTSDDRVSGKHIADYSSKLKLEDISKYNKFFSKYLERGLEPEKIIEHFNQIKKKILASFS